MFSKKAYALLLLFCMTVSAAPLPVVSDDVEILVKRMDPPRPPPGGYPPPPPPGYHGLPPTHIAPHHGPAPLPIPGRHSPGARSSSGSPQYYTPHGTPGSHGSPGSHGTPGSHRSSGSFGSAREFPPPSPGAVDAIRRAGHKIEERDVVRAWQNNRQYPGVDSATSHMWMQHGNDKAGLNHIMKEHGPQWQAKGYSKYDIPELAERMSQRGEFVGVQGRDRPIMRDGAEHAAMTVGRNGYVIGLNPSDAAAAARTPSQKKWGKAIAAAGHGFPPAPPPPHGGYPPPPPHGGYPPPPPHGGYPSPPPHGGYPPYGGYSSSNPPPGGYPPLPPP